MRFTGEPHAPLPVNGARALVAEVYCVGTAPAGIMRGRPQGGEVECAAANPDPKPQELPVALHLHQVACRWMWRSVGVSRESGQDLPEVLGHSWSMFFRVPVPWRGGAGWTTSVGRCRK